MLALDLLPHLEEEARERQQGGRGGILLSPKMNEAKGRATEKAAEIVGVSPSTVENVKAIQKRDETGEIISRMREGDLNVAQAARKTGFGQRKRGPDQGPRVDRSRGGVGVVGGAPSGRGRVGSRRLRCVPGLTMSHVRRAGDFPVLLARHGAGVGGERGPTLLERPRGLEVAEGASRRHGLAAGEASEEEGELGAGQGGNGGGSLGNRVDGDISAEFRPCRHTLGESSKER